MSILLESLGWLGAALVLGAYALLSIHKMRADSYAYHGLNMLGGLLLGLYALWKCAWASIVVNGAWIVIGAIAVAGLWRAKKAR